MVKYMVSLNVFSKSEWVYSLLVNVSGSNVKYTKA